MTIGLIKDHKPALAGKAGNDPSGKSRSPGENDAGAAAFLYNVTVYRVPVNCNTAINNGVISVLLLKKRDGLCYAFNDNWRNYYEKGGFE